MLFFCWKISLRNFAKETKFTNPQQPVQRRLLLYKADMLDFVPTIDQYIYRETVKRKILQYEWKQPNKTANRNTNLMLTVKSGGTLIIVVEWLVANCTLVLVTFALFRHRVRCKSALNVRRNTFNNKTQIFVSSAQKKGTTINAFH